MKNRRKRGRALSQYFLAAVGLALLIFLGAMIATAHSCRPGSLGAPTTGGQ